MPFLKQAAGYALLALGVIGFLLPFIPSLPLFLGAAAILGHDHPIIRPCRERLLVWREIFHFRFRLLMNLMSASRKS